MKPYYLFVPLILFSLSSQAIVLESQIFPAQKPFSGPKILQDRIVITGKPVQLNVHDGFFSFPDSYTIRRSHHFATYLDTARVCFIRSVPKLKGLDQVEIILADQGKKMRWQCYRHDPRYFEIDF